MKHDATFIDDVTEILSNTTAPQTARTTPMPSGLANHLLRGFWMVVFVTVVLMFLLGMPEQYKALTSQSAKYPEYWDIGLQPLGISPSVAGAYDLGLDTLTAFVFLLVGAILFVRRSNDRMAFLASLMLITWGVFVTNDVVIVLTIANPAFLFPFRILSTIGNICLVWFVTVLPDGRFVPRWSIWVVLAYAVFLFAQTTGILAFMPINSGNILQFGVSVVAFLLTASFQLYFRRRQKISVSQFQQIKWILLGFICALIAFIISFTLPRIFPILTVPGPVLTIYELVWQTILLFALSAIPITIAFSVFRYRLWEIDLAINRGVVIVALTAILGLVFLLAIVAIELIFRMLFGQDESGLAVALSALVIGGLFIPVRERVQRFVDRRLYGIAVDFRHLKPSNDLRRTTTVVPIQVRQYGPYIVGAQIGQGGMSEIYLGHHQSLSREAAIKILPAELATHDSMAERFEREAQIIANLHHPNIVQLYDFGRADTAYYMAMEYIHGKSLSAVLRQRNALSLNEALPIIRDLASALDYAHAQGVIHRDVKPSNVMLRESSNMVQAILTDFGIAKMSLESGFTKAGTVVGTLNYMAPEQISGSKELDGRADIYSLGIMVFEMLAGRLPYVGPSAGSIIFGHLQQPIPDIRTINSSIPSQVAMTITKAMAKEPDGRFGTAMEMIEQLEMPARVF